MDSQDHAGSRPATYDYRKELPLKLERAVMGHGFNLHHWAGDGGVFAKRCTSAQDAEIVCKAADAAFSVFEAWLKNHSLDLQCRITATYIPDLLVDPYPGYWFSTALNSFLKYEREIGYAGAFIITNELRREMRKQDRFPVAYERAVRLPTGESFATYVDQTHPIMVLQSSQAFHHWLREHSELTSNPSEFPTILLPANAVSVGNSIVLNGSLFQRGYERIAFKQILKPQAASSFLSESDNPKWKAIRDELVSRDVTGAKLSVSSVTPELSDDPVVRVNWRQVETQEVRAFHTFLENNPKKRNDYAKETLKVLQDGTSVVNNLCNHFIVLLSGDDGQGELLLCHRRKSDRPGTYTSNCWSVSVEEQFNPAERKVGDRIFKADDSVVGSIQRGLCEELLGEDFPDPVGIEIHAFHLEPEILNFGFLGLINLPQTKFADILQLWPNAIDHAEHDALISIPLASDILRKCLLSDHLPSDVLANAKKSSGFNLELSDHAWHPTSRVRLAMALWYSETLQRRA